MAAMKNKLSQVWMLAIAFCFMGAAPTSTVTADEEAVAQTLRLMYVGLTKEDTAQLRAVTTPDFYAFDGGEKYTGDELMTLIKSLHAARKDFRMDCAGAQGAHRRPGGVDYLHQSWLCTGRSGEEGCELAGVSHTAQGIGHLAYPVFSQHPGACEVISALPKFRLPGRRDV